MPSEQTQFAAFFDAPYEWEGLTIRPITAGALACLQSVDSPFVKGSGSEEDGYASLLHYLFACAAPIPEVIKAAKDAAVFRDKALEFGFSYPAAALVRLADSMQERVAAINAVSVTSKEDPALTGTSTKKK